jgi:hypothetical protein
MKEGDVDFLVEFVPANFIIWRFSRSYATSVGADKII